jgi:preprotein translocase subunit Sec61beta
MANGGRERTAARRTPSTVVVVCLACLVLILAATAFSGHPFPA